MWFRHTGKKVDQIVEHKAIEVAHADFKMSIMLGTQFGHIDGQQRGHLRDWGRHGHRGDRAALARPERLGWPSALQCERRQLVPHRPLEVRLVLRGNHVPRSQWIEPKRPHVSTMPGECVSVPPLSGASPSVNLAHTVPQEGASGVELLNVGAALYDNIPSIL